jgi:hypothetical protein
MSIGGLSVDVKTSICMFFFMIIFLASAVYLFKHPSDMNFTTFVGGFTAMGCILHWVCTYDDKHPDTH